MAGKGGARDRGYLEALYGQLFQTYMSSLFNECLIFREKGGGALVLFYVQTVSDLVTGRGRGRAGRGGGLRVCVDKKKVVPQRAISV